MNASTRLGIAGLLLLAAGASGCRREPPAYAVTHRLFDGAIVGSGPGGRAEVRDASIHGDERHTVVVDAPGGVSFRTTAPAAATLSLGLGVRPVEAAVQVELVERFGAAERVLLRETWNGARDWQDRRLALAAEEGEREIALRVSGPPATLFVSEPRLEAPASRRHPDVVVYVVDCLRADRVGAYGYDRPTTPNLDALARDAVLFERAYACAAWTKPSVASLLTAAYPQVHGARTLSDALDPALPTLPEAFRTHGYETAAWVANPVLDNRAFGFGRGFDRYVLLPNQWRGSNVNDVPADAAQITDGALPWLEAGRDRRLFAYLHSLDLHYRYERRPPFDALLVREGRGGLELESDLYDNEIAYNDAQIGRLVARLKQLGLYESTLLVVTSDHGEEFGEHGYDRHGHDVFDTLLHVPLIVKLPGSARHGTRVPTAVSLLDVGPTLLDLAGLPAALPGSSLRPVLEGRPPERTSLFAEQISPSETWYALRRDGHKLATQLVPEPRRLLFDVDGDPGERRDLAASRPDQADAFESELRPFLLAGQEGYHVVFGAGGTAPVTLSVEVGPEARLREVVRLLMRTGDRTELAPSRRSVVLRFTPSDRGRHYVVRTEPVGADLTLAFERAGRPVAASRVHLGSSGTAAGSLPVRVRATEVAVAAGDVERAIQLTEHGDASVFFLPAPSRRVAFDPELAAQLRALGYLNP